MGLDDDTDNEEEDDDNALVLSIGLSSPLIPQQTLLIPLVCTCGEWETVFHCNRISGRRGRNLPTVALEIFLHSAIAKGTKGKE